MNPIPDGIPIPPASLLFPNGHLQLIMLLAILALFVTYGGLLWVLPGLTRMRERVRCPVQPRVANVLFQVSRDGTRVDVLRCSVFGRRPITCGKVCLRPAARG